MQILSNSEGIFVRKEDGTNVVYHIFPECEVHYNEVPPNTVQLWHHHELIEELIFIISGEIEVQWKENGHACNQTAQFGNLIRVEKSPHTLINTSKEVCAFVVFRFLPSGINKNHIIKNDKYLD